MTEPEVLKKSLVNVLKWVSSFASAGAVNPLFSVAASLIKVVETSVDDKCFKNLEREFEDLNKAINVILDQKIQILLNIKKTEVDAQYTNIEEYLRSQFSSYLKIVKAKPEHLQSKKDDFISRYEFGEIDQKINNLYDLLVGNRKLFSKTIQGYSDHSKGNKEVMKNLYIRLAYLFSIGCITTMTYYEFKNDHMKNRKEDWEKKIHDVKEAVDKWI
ncbi:protein rapunzel-like isoform X2 [Triplophysa dalaica]|uniref:protein rapunzel-like isoform X2 n=1 Tax=Triplophysa dalaica TaxID=1582913 RepID=UPI0024DF5284|nr:protein rapunzel-like isoform X2 [Triplophysa dalaica]